MAKTLEQRAMDCGADLVMEGGGVKGLGLAGAVITLSDAGYVFPRVGGTSAGAIVAATHPRARGLSPGPRQWNRYALDEDGVASRNVWVDTMRVQATDFHIDRATQQKLYDNGCAAAHAFLSEWAAVHAA